MSKKTFANLQYPGIKANPDEGKHKLSEAVRSRFADQIAAIGEESQVALMESSVLIVAATPLGVQLAKNLLGIGIGRVGVVGDHSNALATLREWKKQNIETSELETFGSISLDRQMSDILRGFKYVICTECVRSALPKATSSLNIDALSADLTSKITALILKKAPLENSLESLLLHPRPGCPKCKAE